VNITTDYVTRVYIRSRCTEDGRYFATVRNCKDDDETLGRPDYIIRVGRHSSSDAGALETLYEDLYAKIEPYATSYEVDITKWRGKRDVWERLYFGKSPLRKHCRRGSAMEDYDLKDHSVLSKFLKQMFTPKDDLLKDLLKNPYTVAISSK
jgi:hypothetical protein